MPDPARRSSALASTNAHDGAVSTSLVSHPVGHSSVSKADQRAAADRATGETTDYSVALPERVAGLTPAEFADRLPGHPILTSAGHGWSSLALYRYRPSSGFIDIPALRDHKLVLHLAGPALIEGECGGHRERRWADSGHIGLVPAGMPLVRSAKGRPDLLHIFVDPALVDEAEMEAYGHDPAHVSLVERLAVPDVTLDRLGRLLLAEAEANDPGTRLFADGLARAFAVRLLRCHSSLAPTVPEAPGSIAGGRLRRVIEHMHANLAEELPLTQLAAVGGLSPSQFARAFRAATGEPPHRYLTHLRVERARDLLEHTDLSVIEVGMRCGFGQPAHFATVFGKLTGMSPRAWRRARRL